MGRGRYSSTPVVDGNSYGTWTSPLLDGPDIDPLRGLRTVDHLVVGGERLDTIASLYWQDEEDWWVIAFLNGIVSPLDVAPGDVIRVPLDRREAIDRVLPPPRR